MLVQYTARGGELAEMPHTVPVPKLMAKVPADPTASEEKKRSATTVSTVKNSSSNLIARMKSRLGLLWGASSLGENWRREEGMRKWGLS